MSASRMEGLHSFLNEEGRELVVINFFLRPAWGLTMDQIEEEAKGAIKRALKAGLRDTPPVSGFEKASF